MTPCTGWDDPVHGFSTQLIRLYIYLDNFFSSAFLGTKKRTTFETDFYTFFDVFSRFSVSNPNEQKGTPKSSAETRFRIWQY